MADDHQQRNALKEFLAVGSRHPFCPLKPKICISNKFLVNSDDQRRLVNITAPPFVLADKSTTELPRYWVEHPELFCAPAHESSAERRILAVLKWFLTSLRGQQYAGREPNAGVKKPLNAFLGEIFTGACGPEDDETHLVSEQVSHHPPVTACSLWNDKAGVRAEGFTRQEITFNGSVNIQQIGYALLHIDSCDEDYLIPLPNVKVKGILTGGTYPELTEPCSIVSSAGYVADIDFSGKGLFGFGGQKNHVEAAVYRSDDSKKKDALFIVGGSWTDTMTFKDMEGETIESYDVSSAKSSEFRTLTLEKQDPWESRKAWNGVIQSLHAGNMRGVADEKSKLENAQRELRKQDQTSEGKWKAVFFRKEDKDAKAEKLLSVVSKKFDPKDTCGVWVFDKGRAKELGRPWRGSLTPHGTTD